MSMFTCPKCGKPQPIENKECSQCGIIFNKLLNKKPEHKKSHPVHQDINIPVKAPKEFLPQVGLNKNLEITILNIVAYVYLILGIGTGVGIIIQGKNELSLFIGFSVIIGAIITSMLFFVICTIAKKILSIDNSLKYIAKGI